MVTSTAPASRPQVRPARKPHPRPTRCLYLPSQGHVTIRVGREETTYRISEFPVGGAYDGRAFAFTKPDGERYDVFLCRHGQNDSCDCRGFVAHGHCKHRDAARTLLQLGLLGDAPAPTGDPANHFPCRRCGSELVDCCGVAWCPRCPVTLLPDPFYAREADDAEASASAWEAFTEATAGPNKSSA